MLNRVYEPMYVYVHTYVVSPRGSICLELITELIICRRLFPQRPDAARQDTGQVQESQGDLRGSDNERMQSDREGAGAAGVGQRRHGRFLVRY